MSVLFGLGIFRFGVRGLAEVGAGLTSFQWTVLLLMVVLFVYGEGFLALQRHWVPRMAGAGERASRLRAARNAIVLILAPLHAMSLLGGNTRERVRRWSVVASVVTAVIVVEWLPAPRRGIVDLGVACALWRGDSCSWPKRRSEPLSSVVRLNSLGSNGRTKSNHHYSVVARPPNLSSIMRSAARLSPTISSCSTTLPKDASSSTCSSMNHCSSS